jgi:peptidoglycan/LPS O-acetylase OafA/YrhL
VTRRTSLPALTGARFLAAASVVVYHYGQTSLSPRFVILSNAGPAAVSFFYVLSGTVLTWSSSTANFWAHRARRVLPAYFLALALSLVPFAIQSLHQHDFAGAAVRIVGGLLACGLLLQAFWPPAAAGLNTPGWSISCEAFFYALWPRLVKALEHHRRNFPWSAAVLAWSAGLIPPLAGIALLKAGLLPRGPFATLTINAGAPELLCRALAYFPPFRLPELILGIVIGHGLRATPVRKRSVANDNLREGLLTAATLAAAWLLGSGLASEFFEVPLADRIFIEGGILSPIFGLWVWQLARSEGLLKRLLSQKPFLILGEASYALYILQDPVVTFFSGAMKRLTHAPWSQLFWLYFALLIAISLLVHRFYELRFKPGSSPPR